MKPSLFKKILVAIVVILLPIIVSFIYIYHHDKQYLIDNIQKELTVIANAYEGQIYQFLEMSRSRVNDFATDGIIREHFQNIAEGRESGDKFLVDYLIKHKKSIDKSIHSISLMTFDGRILVSTDRSRIGKYFEIDASPARTDGRYPFVGSEVRFSGMEQIVSLAPVFSIRDDRPLGLIVNHIFLTELNHLLSGKYTKTPGIVRSEDTRRNTFEVYLVNRNKLMITESKFVKDSVLRQEVNTPPVNACLEEGRVMSGLYPDYRGIAVAGASMCIPSMKWTLLAEIDADEVLAPLAVMRRNAVIASLGVIGLIILFFVFLFRSVIVPLKKFSGAAEGIASGNYEITVPVQSHDEIGRLAGLFNKMGQEIGHRTNLLRSSEERLRAIIDNSPSVIYLKDTDGKYLLVNRRFKELFRLSNQEITGKTDFDLFPKEFAETFRENDIKVLKSNTHIEFDEKAPQDDGIHDYISVKFPVSNIAGVPFAVCGISTDITELKSLENQLRLSQKMEAVGQLAGGVAHDFNNILTGITGYAALLSMKTETEPVLKGYATHIVSLAEKAAKLTQGLLAFSRKQIMHPGIHDLNEITNRFIQILSGIIGGNIGIVSKLSDDNLHVMADSSLIEQALMNLATNSKDAMAGDGTITIETGLISSVNIQLDKTKKTRAAGNYALLRFSDTGVGIPAELIDKIFDPFFTTREVGKGTGLGLSTVHGIIEQHDGIITVESEVSRGTTFNIYLPIREA